MASYAYTYDGDGNVLSMTTVDGTVTYGYNAQDELTAAGSDSYNYDTNGNRTTFDGSTYTNAANELLYDGKYTYSYDAEGNMTARWVASTTSPLETQPGAGDTDITVYTWDNRNRLTSVTHYAAYGAAPSQTVTYIYDAFNQLVGETVAVPGEATQETVYAYDRGQIALQFDGAGTGQLSASDLSHRNLWNSQAVDQLFADEQVTRGLSQAGDVLWTLTDQENSVRDLATYSNGTTTIKNHRIYDAYGNLTSQTGVVDCIFGYTGRQFDANTGLQNNLNRWYNPSSGRWMSEDPLGFSAGDINVFRYCDDNPLAFADPRGTGDIFTWFHNFFTNNVYPTKGRNSAINRGGIPVPSIPFPGDIPPSQPPGPGFKWIGRGEPGTEGNWFNPNTGESFHNDMQHALPIGPHWDYWRRGCPDHFRWDPNGKMTKAS